MLKHTKKIVGATFVLSTLLAAAPASDIMLDMGLVAQASAAEQQDFTGSWYDSAGHFVLSIKPGVINNCKVVRSYDVKAGNPGSGHYVILTAAGESDLFIEWEGGYWQDGTYVAPHVTLNHGEKLSRK